jgi:hypothetical protein
MGGHLRACVSASVVTGDVMVFGDGSNVQSFSGKSASPAASYDLQISSTHDDAVVGTCLRYRVGGMASSSPGGRLLCIARLMYWLLRHYISTMSPSDLNKRGSAALRAQSRSRWAMRITGAARVP